MSRTRASAKTAGTRFETSIARYLAEHVDDRIERRTKTGAADRGDIAGLRTSTGKRIIVECKNTTRVALAEWQRETEVERQNDGAIAGIIAHKRHGKTNPGDQWVTMTMADLAALITDQRKD